MDLTSVIMAVISFLGTALGAFSGMKLTAYRIGELEKKVEAQSSVFRKLPVIEEQIKVVNHRLEDLERGK